jgi:hypothetical protein
MNLNLKQLSKIDEDLIAIGFESGEQYGSYWTWTRENLTLNLEHGKWWVQHPDIRNDIRRQCFDTQCEALKANHKRVQSILAISSFAGITED